MLLSLWLLSAPAAAAPGWTLALPLGVPQFVHGRPGMGALFAGLQVIGIGATAVATSQVYRYADSEDGDLYLTWRMVSSGTVAFTAAAWFASALGGSRLHQLELEHRAAAGRAWPSRQPAAMFDPSLEGLDLGVPLSGGGTWSPRAQVLTDGR